MREQRRAVGTSSAERPKLRASGADEWTRPEGTMANSPRFQPGVDFNREGKSQRDDVSHARHNRNKQASNEHVHQSHISHHIQHKVPTPANRCGIERRSLPIHRWNHPRRKRPAPGNRWYDRSRPPSGRIPPNGSRLFHAATRQGQFIQVGQRSEGASTQIRVASWLRCLHGQSIPSVNRERVHPAAGRTPQEAEFQGRILGFLETAQHRL